MVCCGINKLWVSFVKWNRKLGSMGCISCWEAMRELRGGLMVVVVQFGFGCLGLRFWRSGDWKSDGVSMGFPYVQAVDCS